jgi:hypothetical protein
MAQHRRRWILLAYRMPREPSTPRIGVWRKLRGLGVAQIVDGLVAIPDSVVNLEHMGWVANDVLDAGGEATLWSAELASVKQERVLVARLNGDVAESYRSLAVEIDAAVRDAGAVGRRQRDRFQRELRDIIRRDHLGASGRDRAERALQRLLRVAVAV